MPSNLLRQLLPVLLVLLTPLLRAAAPTNDSFAAAEVLSGFPISTSGTNLEASLEAGEPIPSGLDGFTGKSVWYEWTATATGEVFLNTFGSDFDTILTVWTGSSLGELSEVVTSDQYATTSQSAFFLNAVAGTTYRIAVYGWGPTTSTAESGTIALSIGPDTTSSISGTVYQADGTTPIQGVQVQAVEYYGPIGFEATTAADGSYTIRGLIEGDYALKFSHPLGTYAVEYWNDQPSYDFSDRVTVPIDADVLKINASLSLGGEIRGRVVNPAGELLGNLAIAAYLQVGSGEFASWQPVFYGMSGTEDYGVTPGNPVNFSLTGLQPGTYHLVFSDYTGNFTTALYLNALDHATATDITVTGGTITTLSPMVMRVTSSISGTINGPGGVLLGDIEVIAYRQNPDPLDPYWLEVRHTYTNALDGRYTLNGLEAGNYRIQFSDTRRLHLTEYYNNQPAFADALTLTVGEGTQTLGIDAELAPAGIIAGSVYSAFNGQPLTNVLVQIFRASDGDFIPDYYAFTNMEGNYVSEALPGGDYYLRFEDWNNAHETIYLSSTGGSTESAGATPVTVELGMTALASQPMNRFPSISGTVQSTSGTPLADIGVAAFDAISGARVGQTQTSTDGTYVLAGLPIESDVRVSFYDPSGTYLEEWHSNAPDFLLATNVTLGGLNTSFVNLNAELEAAGRISGRVVSSVDGLPIPQVQVIAYREVIQEGVSTLLYQSLGLTDSNGYYDIRALQPGTYLLYYLHTGFKEYLSEYHNDQPSEGPATTRFTVAVGSILPNVDVDLTPFSKIQGQITDPLGTPIGNAFVTLYTFDGESWNSSETVATDENGDYTLGGLVAGSYRLEFTDPSGVYASEFYSNATSLATATDVEVTPGLSISGLDASLAFTIQVDPKITSLRKTGPTDYQIDFEGNVGTRYQLQQSTTLAGWTPVGDPFICIAGTNSFFITTTEPRVFWRFVTVP